MVNQRYGWILELSQLCHLKLLSSICTNLPSLLFPLQMLFSHLRIHPSSNLLCLHIKVFYHRILSIAVRNIHQFFQEWGTFNGFFAFTGDVINTWLVLFHSTD